MTLLVWGRLSSLLESAALVGFHCRTHTNLIIRGRRSPIILILAEPHHRSLDEYCLKTRQTVVYDLHLRDAPKSLWKTVPCAYETTLPFVMPKGHFCEQQFWRLRHEYFTWRPHSGSTFCLQQGHIAEVSNIPNGTHAQNAPPQSRYRQWLTLPVRIFMAPQSQYAPLQFPLRKNSREPQSSLSRSFADCSIQSCRTDALLKCRLKFRLFLGIRI